MSGAGCSTGAEQQRWGWGWGQRRAVRAAMRQPRGPLGGGGSCMLWEPRGGWRGGGCRPGQLGMHATEQPADCTKCEGSCPPLKGLRRWRAGGAATRLRHPPAGVLGSPLSVATLRGARGTLGGATPGRQLLHPWVGTPAAIWRSWGGCACTAAGCKGVCHMGTHASVPPPPGPAAGCGV
jgi:hypothetical protein